MALPELKVIGKSENHDKVGHLVASCKADFASDRLPLVKYYAASKGATVMRGVVKNVDASRALDLPGVIAVVTHEDIPIWNEAIFWWGQEVAGVIAEDPQTARYALTLIDVEYEERPGIYDPDESMRDGAPLIGVRPDSNYAVVTDLKRGDLEEGMASADVVLETNQDWTNTFQHNCMEAHQSLAWWVGDHVYCWIPSQHVFGAKNAIVNGLGLPANKVHVYTRFTGTGHGDKAGDIFTAATATMSKIVGGAPVLFEKGRYGSMLQHGRQFDLKSEIKWGANSDGKIVAVDAKFFGNGGVHTWAPVGNVHFGLRTTYDIPNANFQVTSVNTNTPGRSYWRCVNDPPGAANYDPALFKLAEKLDMDPYDVVMKNLLPDDAPDLDPPNRVWGGRMLKDMFEWCHQASGYANKYHKPGTKPLDDGRLHGIAITGHMDSHGGVNGAGRGAIVTMLPDGRCFANVGGARGCEGGPTICCHVVAEALGMKYEDVGLGRWGDTDTALDAGIQAGSTFTAGAGGAFYSAAMDLRKKLFEYAITKDGFRDIEGITPEDLDAEDSEVFYKGDTSIRLTYRQVMAGTPPTAGSGNGWGSTLRSRSVGGVPIGEPCNSNGSACTAVEVAVDTDTGEVEVTGMWNAVDTGRTIFKQGTDKEMWSGIELMLWQALLAGDVYDPATSACLSTQWTESMMITPLDFKGENFVAQDFESDDAAGPYGAHGIGEPCVTNYSAILCAIHNATGKWVDMNHGPCTPDVILKSLGKA